MMYNRIYRNMLFLCSMVLILTLTVSLLGIFVVYNYNIDNELEESAARINHFINISGNADKVIDKLNKEDSERNYNIIFDENNCGCKKNSFCTTLRLNDGNILHISQSHFEAMSPFYITISLILFLGLLIFFLSIRFAAVLAGTIVKPFTDNFADEETYDEVLPLTRAIEFQHKEIKRQTENAKAREVELQLITDNMNEGLIILNNDGIILSVNSFAAKIFNVDEYTIKLKSYTHLIDNTAFKNAVESALSSNRSNALIELGNAYYRIYCSPIIKNTVPEGIIILLFDVTSTYQSEKLRREFSANVSHELKTPLTSINGYAQIISSGIAKSDDIPHFAEKIAKESNRLMILIEDIMHLSNLDEGAPYEPEKEVSIEEIISDIISSLSDKAEKRNISIFLSGNDFTVTANKTQLSELIYNIIDNAVKYNKDNGSVRVIMADNSVSVADTGIGIPAEYTDRIFERFFRVDKSHSKKVDGTGLGLSIVKHIAKQNNISIDVKSTLGEGSIFTIYF